MKNTVKTYKAITPITIQGDNGDTIFINRGDHLLIDENWIIEENTVKYLELDFDTDFTPEEHNDAIWLKYGTIRLLKGDEWQCISIDALFSNHLEEVE